jgi:hypothetical protein
MIEILEQIKSDATYQKDPLTYTANITCQLLNDFIDFEQMTTLEEIAALIAFGGMLLNASLRNMTFDDPKEIEKVYEVIHDEYDRSEKRLRQALA